MEAEEQLRQLEFRLRHTMEFVEIDHSGESIEKRYLLRKIGNVKIEIYPNEHPPPHFHIRSPDVNATFEIVTGYPSFGTGGLTNKKENLLFSLHQQVNAH